MSNELTFDLKSLRDFLANFNPVAERLRANRWLALLSQPKLASDTRKEIHDHMIKLERHAALYRPQLTTARKHSEIWEDLRQVYGEDEQITEYLHVYTLIQDKLIRKFISIPGMDKLYQSEYFRFEWKMHLNTDFSNHRQSYYRDHFVHQAKNVHMIYQFLTNMGFMDAIKGILLKSNTPSVQFIKDSIERSKIEYHENTELYQLFENQHGLCMDEGSTAITKDEFLEDCLTERLLLTVAVISGLFHDLGYPISFSMNSIEQMGDFLPVSHYFFHGTQSFTRINALLTNSLLFTIVSAREIEKRFLERDHGTLSALAFLLYFYENGAIFSMSTLDRAAVELAAITIYDHTLEYVVDSEPSKNKYQGFPKTKYYRPSFYVTPISYLFRLCDDLQEWGRVYFYLSKSHNFRICTRCGMPIVYAEAPGKKGSPAICGCYDSSLTTPFTSRTKVSSICTRASVVENATTIGYRKLYNIKICDRVTVVRISARPNSVPSGYVVDIQYDLYKMLEMCPIDPSFGVKRAKELCKTRIRLEDQWGMPIIAVNSVVTNNPIILKLRILEEFLVEAAKGAATITKADQHDGDAFYWTMAFSKDAEKLLRQIVDASDGSWDENKWNNVEKSIIAFFELLASTYRKQAMNGIYDRLKFRIPFYCKLLVLTWSLRAGQIQFDLSEANEISPENPGYMLWQSIRPYMQSNKSVSPEFAASQRICYNALNLLVRDCICQYSNCGVSPREAINSTGDTTYVRAFDYTPFVQRGDPFPEHYLDQFVTLDSGNHEEDILYQAVNQYCSPKTYSLILSNDTDVIDFYTDLYFFQMLANTLGHKDEV